MRRSGTTLHTCGDARRLILLAGVGRDVRIVSHDLLWRDSHSERTSTKKKRRAFLFALPGLNMTIGCFGVFGSVTLFMSETKGYVWSDVGIIV